MEESARRCIGTTKSAPIAKIGRSRGGLPFLDVNPVQKNQGKGAGADDEPEGDSLEQGAEADAPEGFLVEASADEEEGYGEADLAEMIECAERAMERRQERVQKGRAAEQQNEPRPLDACAAFQGKGGDQRQRDDPKGAGEFDSGADGQSGGAVFGGSANDGAGVVDGQGGPEAELRLAHFERVADDWKCEQGDGVENEDGTKRDSHFFFVGVGDRADGGDRAAAADGRAGANQEGGFFCDLKKV